MRGGEQFQNHPCRFRNLSRMLPLVIHGDGFPASGIGKSWSKVMDSWQWASLLVNAPSKLSVFLIFCVHNALRSSQPMRDTLAVMFQKLVWSFNAIWEGTWPSLTWNNEPIVDAKANPFSPPILTSAHTSYDIAYVYVCVYIYIYGCLARVCCLFGLRPFA